MKPIHVGLLVAAAALGGAIFMKVVNSPEPASEPAVTASAPAENSAGQTVTPVEQVPAEPKPAPFVEEQPERKAPQRPAPARTSITRKPTRESEPPPAPVQQPAPPPVQQTPEPVAQTPPPAPAPEPERPSNVFKPAEPPAPPPARKVTLTAGTLIPVRVVESLVSDRLSIGDTFNATLDAPLRVNDLVIAERGAKAQGRVVRLEESGRVKGVAALAIELTSIRTSDGQTVRVQTDTFERQAEKELAKDAAKVGVASGIGAAIGAIAGGGKGAGIGAAVGGAAGAGGVMATRGKPATIPSETKISFRLSQPVTITEQN
jgi:outer membrane biosynthesis protein TonB